MVVVKIKTIAMITCLMGGASLLSGCVGGPTYGTDKTAGAQLLDDIGNIVSLGDDSPRIDYKPRPDLVKPPKDATATLPAPQTALVDDKTQWPESPEELRDRLRAEATENKDNNLYVSPLKGQGPDGRDLTAEQQRAEYKRRRALQEQAYQGSRVLSDPPVEYRIPASTAPSGELGETEKAKEQRRKEAATQKKKRRWWWQRN